MESCVGSWDVGSLFVGGNGNGDPCEVMIVISPFKVTNLNSEKQQYKGPVCTPFGLLEIKLPSAFALESQSPSGPRKPLHASVTFWEAYAP
nr:Metallocarboxypeptidase inhibitor [Ipomoea batatas]